MSDAQRGWPTNASLRLLLGEVFRLPEELDAFCIDHFPVVATSITGEMGSMKKVNVLLTAGRPAEILAKLRQAQPDKVREHERLLVWETALTEPDPVPAMATISAELRKRILGIAGPAAWPLEDLVDAYHASAPPGWRCDFGRDRREHLVLDMLVSLASALGQSDGAHPILRFVEHLKKLPCALELIQELTDWFVDAAHYLGVDAARQQALQRAVTATDLRAERKIHLVIVMSRSETALDRFRVEAYRVLARPGQTSWSDGDVERLSGDGERLYALDEIAEPLNDLVLELDDDLSQSRNPLTIELVLPLDLLCCDADRWVLTEDSIPLGVEHEVVVRSWERAYGVRKGQSLARWQAKWRQIGDATAGHHVWVCHPQDAAVGLTPKLVPSGPACVAMRYTPARNASGGAPAVLRELIAAGTPIAVWPRETPNEAQLKEWFERLIVEKSPLLWHEAVRHYRVEAYRTDKPAAHPGHHLTVLRDDPNKLLPDARASARLASPAKTRISAT